MNLRNFWTKKSGLNLLLLPFSALFYFAQTIRRTWYRLFPPQPFSCPVIVIGNISVGGAGKSPVVMYCAERLRAHGYKPGIVSRGYGGKSSTYPLFVTAASDPSLCGDEPVMMAKRLGCPVVVDPCRARAVRTLLEKTDCNVVLSDDGLQHYAMHRDIEVVVVDGKQGLGNGWLLPAGPLRELPSRLKSVHFVLGLEGYPITRSIAQWVNVKDPQAVMKPSAFDDILVHAIAGIAKPQAFFDACRGLGMRLETHAYNDHAPYVKEQVYFADGFPVVMTEKDAVKCKDLVSDNTWYALLKLEIDPEFEQALLKQIVCHTELR